MVETKNVKGVGTFVLAVVITVLALIFLILPKWSEYKEKAQQKEQAQTDLEELQQTEQEFNQSVALLTKGGGVKLLDDAIPVSASIPDLYAHLETMVKSANMNLIAVSATDQTAPSESAASANGTIIGTDEMSSSAPVVAGLPPSLGVVNVSIDTSGTIEGYKLFLRSLERSLRLLDVQTISISSTEDGSDFRTTLRTYYQK